MKKILAVTSLFFVMILISIARRNFWYPDEPDMAEITRHMLMSGDWLRLQLYNKLFADYPPLFFWLTSGVGAVAGMSEIVLRLPTALSAVLLVMLSGVWARRRFGDRAGFWTAVVMATCTQFVWQAINMHVDMLFALLIGASIFVYDLTRDHESRLARLGFFSASGLLMGLASLVKGPAGFLMPCGILAVYHLANGEYRLLKQLTFTGTLSVLVFGAWSYVYAVRAGDSNLFYFIYEQNITRFLTGHSHLQPWFFHIANIWADLAPWSLFLPFALVYAWKVRRDRSSLLVFLWFTLTFAFFTISRSKRQVYLLPLYPAAAVLLGCYISELIAAASEYRAKVFRVALMPMGFILAAIGLLLPIALPALGREFPESAIVMPALALSVVTVVGGVAVVVLLKRQRAVQAIRVLPVVAALICVVGFGWLAPNLDASLSAKEHARWLAAEHIGEGEVLGCLRPIKKLHKESSTLSFYGNFRVEVYAEHCEIEEYMRRQPGDVLLIRDKDMAWLERANIYSIEIVRRIRIGGDRFFALMLTKREVSEVAMNLARTAEDEAD